MLLQKFDKNKDGDDLVVGDIHGCFSLLREELSKVGFDVNRDRLFCVGDLVDRGPESIEATEWLKEPWFYSVRGNHEQMAIDYCYSRDHGYNYARNGGQWFIDLDHDTQGLIIAEFEELPYAFEIATAHGPVGIIHAEVPGDDWDNVAEMQDRYDKEKALWSRDKIMTSNTHDVANIRRVYVGHTPLKEVAVLGNVHYIDTGAVYTESEGKLTIVNITKTIGITT